MAKIDRKQQNFIFRHAKLIGWLASLIGIILLIVGIATSISGAVSGSKALTTFADAFKVNEGETEVKITLQVENLKQVNSQFFEPIDSSLKLMVAGVTTFFIARIAVNVVLLLRAISDNKKGIIPSKSLLIHRFIYYPLVIVSELVIMIVTSVLLSTYLVDIVNAVTEANAYLIRQADGKTELILAAGSAGGELDTSGINLLQGYANKLKENSSILEKVSDIMIQAVEGNADSTQLENVMKDEMNKIINLGITSAVFNGIWLITNIVYGIIAKVKVGKAVRA